MNNGYGYAWLIKLNILLNINHIYITLLFYCDLIRCLLKRLM